MSNLLQADIWHLLFWGLLWLAAIWCIVGTAWLTKIAWGKGPLWAAFVLCLPLMGPLGFGLQYWRESRWALCFYLLVILPLVAAGLVLMQMLASGKFFVSY